MRYIGLRHSQLAETAAGMEAKRYPAVDRVSKKSVSAVFWVVSVLCLAVRQPFPSALICRTSAFSGLQHTITQPISCLSQTFRVYVSDNVYQKIFKNERVWQPPWNTIRSWDQRIVLWSGAYTWRLRRLQDREETSVETAFLGGLLGKSIDLVWSSILPEGVQWLSGLFGGLN